MKTFIKKVIFLFLLFTLVIPTPAVASESMRINDLEKRIVKLEAELVRLKKQEERASKYLKCIQKVDGIAITAPFKILNCIRK